MELEKQILINELKDKEIALLNSRIDDLKEQILNLKEINLMQKEKLASFEK